MRSIWKRIIPAGILVGLGAAPALAHAETDSYVELQLGADTFADLVRRAVASDSTFCPQEVRAGDETVYADHIAIDRPGTFSRAPSVSRIAINDFASVTSRAVRYTQPLEVHLKTLACGADPGCAETTPVAATVTYELYTKPSGQLCLRSSESHGLPEGMAAPEVDACVPFQADQALKLAGFSGEAASGTGVTLNRDGSRIAVRVELGRAAADYDVTRLAAWQAFADGAIETTGASGDWSVFAHQSLIAAALEHRLTAALAGFTVDGPVKTEWTDLGDAGGRISVHLDGALSGTICPDKIRVHDITITADVGDDGQGLATRGRVSYDIDDEDAARCGLALGGPAGAVVMGALADVIKVDFSSVGPSCSAEKDFDFACHELGQPARLSVGPLQTATAALARVTGAPAGLALGGSLRASGSAAPVTGGEVTAIAGQESVLRVTGTGVVCRAHMWADRGGDIGLFAIGEPTHRALPATYRVSLDAEHAKAYAANPFPVMATVMTPAGVRTYRLDSAK